MMAEARVRRFDDAHTGDDDAHDEDDGRRKGEGGGGGGGGRGGGGHDFKGGVNKHDDKQVHGSAGLVPKTGRVVEPGAYQRAGDLARQRATSACYCSYSLALWCENS